jgi:hypothetical protein
MDRRRQLLAWIEATMKTQRRLAILLVLLVARVALSVGLAAWSKPVGTFAFIGVAALGGCGFWVTAAHLEAARGGPPGSAARRAPRAPRPPRTWGVPWLAIAPRDLR